MRKFGLLGILLMLVMGLTFIPAQTTYAQEEGCVDYLDGNGPGDWELTPFGGPFPSHFGSYNATDDRFEGEYNAPADGKQNSILLTLDTPTTIASIEVDVDYDSTLFSVQPYFILSIDYDGVQQDTEVSTTSPAADTITHLYDTPVSGVSEIYMNHTVFTNSGDGHTWITRIRVCFGDAPGGLTRPLGAADEHPDWGIFDYTYANEINEVYSEGDTVLAFSTTFGASVAAVSAGTVVSVVPYTPADCAGFLLIGMMSFDLGNLRWCNVAVPGAINGNGWNAMFALEMINNWRVIVQDAVDPGIFYQYIVTNPTVAVGDEVVAGCVIGQTIQVKTLPFGIIQIGVTIAETLGLTGGLGFLSPETQAGVTFVTMYEFSEDDIEVVRLYPSLTIPPNLTNCRDELLSGCANENPSLPTLDYYNYTPGVSVVPGGGVIIPVDDQIYQQAINIDPEVTYSLNVQARALTVAGGDDEINRLRLTLGQGEGQETATFNITGGWNTYTLTPAGAGWIYNTNLTDISVRNGGGLIRSLSADIEVRYVCLAPVTASTAPGSCYFANHEFDLDATGWIISATSFASGQAYMVHDATISQDVRLLPGDDGPHTYTIKAVGRLLATSAYTGQVGKEVALEYKYPSAGSFTEVGVIDSAAVIANGLSPVNGAVVLEYPYTLSTTVEITEETDSSFIFRVQVTDIDNYITGMRLDSVCINPGGDGVFPGQPGDGGYDPPFIPGCSVVPVPIEGSVAAWTFYHWSQLKRFFYCDLMKLLNNWFKLFDSFRRTMLGVARYWIALVHYISDWIGNVFRWLDGHFRNIAVGQVTIVNQGGGGAGIWDVLLAIINGILSPLLNIATKLFDLLVVLVGTAAAILLAALVGIIALGVLFIAQILSLLTIGKDLLLVLINAFNATATVVPPVLPACQLDPQQHPLCVGFWVLENTIFSGTGAWLIPVIVSIGSIHLILWIVGEVKRTIMQMGRVV